MENTDFRTKPEMNPEHEENKSDTVISHQTFAITDKKLKLGVHHTFRKVQEVKQTHDHVRGTQMYFTIF